MGNWEQIANDSFSNEFVNFKNTLKGAGGRRPDAVSFTNIEGDVKRRDLTINALFYDIDTHEIVDLVGGLEDIKNGVVRTVGAAEDRFGEDRLRILRAIRFAGRFGSELDPETDAALQKDASLEGISGERIRDEFLKGLKSAKSTKKFLEMIDKYGLFKFIFNGLNVDLSLLRTLNRNEDDYIVLIARLLKTNTIDSIRRKLNDLKYPDDEIKAIIFLVGLLRLDVETAIPLKKAQKHTNVSSDQIRNFGANEGISSQLLDAFEAFELTVSGPEVMDKTGLKPGPELGKEIQRLEMDNFKKLIHEDLMYGYIVDGKKVKITEQEYKQRVGEGLIMTHSSEKTKEMLERWMGAFFTVLLNSDDNILFVMPKDKSKDKIDWLFKFMDNMGYFFSGYYNKGTLLGKTIKNDNYTGLRFEAKFDIEYPKKARYLYHATPISKLVKIMDIGLVPKSYSKATHHPDRIYLALSLSKALEIADMFKTGEYVDGKLAILKIDTKGLSNKFLIDINFDGGVYTTHNIPPSNIEIERA